MDLVISNTKYYKQLSIQSIRELWELEDTYINKFNSIENGFNCRFNKNIYNIIYRNGRH